MTSESLPRRVTRLENDTVAIYEILTDIRRKQATHDRRFQQIDARFEQVDARFQQIDARFEQIDARFQQIDARFEQIDGKLDEVLRRLPGSA